MTTGSVEVTKAGRMVRRTLRAGAVALGVLALAGCSHGPLHIKHHRVRPGRIGLPPTNVTTIGVNSYLWRASLDVLSFMPLVQTDSNGGVIVTDWYTNPNSPNERMKITVTVLDKDLRSDALRVAASRQVSQGGTWVDAPVKAATIQQLEDVILTKARDLRRGTIQQ